MTNRYSLVPESVVNLYIRLPMSFQTTLLLNYNIVYICDTFAVTVLYHWYVVQAYLIKHTYVCLQGHMHTQWHVYSKLVHFLVKLFTRFKLNIFLIWVSISCCSFSWGKVGVSPGPVPRSTCSGFRHCPVSE